MKLLMILIATACLSLPNTSHASNIQTDIYRPVILERGVAAVALATVGCIGGYVGGAAVRLISKGRLPAAYAAENGCLYVGSIGLVGSAIGSAVTGAEIPSDSDLSELQ